MKNPARRFGIVLLSVLFLCLSLTGAAGAQEYLEAPIHAERVRTGELPPVDERLPKNPLVVGPGVILPEDNVDWQPGEYGGVLRLAHSAPDWDAHVFIMMNETLISAPGVRTEGVRPEIVEEFTISDDNRLFTFRLREGMRWSDGTPLTTEDVRFAYEDVMHNEMLEPTFPHRYRGPDGEPMNLQIIDDYTFTIGFNEPYGGFIGDITYMNWVGYTDLIKPSHFLRDYHIDYTPLEDMAEGLAAEELDDEWWLLFEARDATNWDLTRPQALGFPVLYPWVQVEAPPGVIAFEPNPYYYKVDTEGRQLPYIERVETHYVTDMQMIQLRALSGETNYMGHDHTGLSQMALYREHEERSGFRTVLLGRHNNPVVLFINYTYPDEAWREVTGDVRFRRALSLAIDSQEIVDSVFFGMAENPETIGMPGRFDPDEAGELLDAMDMNQRDAEGYRLAPDGSRFEIRMEIAEISPDMTPTAELLAEYFGDVGIRTDVRQISAELRGQRVSANEVQATLNWMPEPQWRDEVKNEYLPGQYWQMAGPEWGAWFTSDGESGVEPPEPIQRMYELHSIRQRYPSRSAEDAAAMEEIYEIHAEQLYYIWLVGDVSDPLIVPENLRNVPHGGWSLEASHSGEQYFFVNE